MKLKEFINLANPFDQIQLYVDDEWKKFSSVRELRSVRYEVLGEREVYFISSGYENYRDLLKVWVKDV